MEPHRYWRQLMSIALLAIVPCLPTLLAQEKKRLDSHAAMTEYSFYVKAGREIRVHVQLDDTGTITETFISMAPTELRFKGFLHATKTCL